MRMIKRDELSAPARVTGIEISSLPTAQDIDVARYESLWCLTRMNGVPQNISFWDVRDDRSIQPSSIVRHLRDAGALDVDDDPHTAPATEAPDHDVDVTVVICTHERPADLQRALASLADQSDSGFRTLVVDNAPQGPATAQVVEASNLANCEYLVESHKGLSRARNTALARITSDYVAWMDDDEMADRDWITHLKRGFGHPAHPAAVCGLMLPAELETRPQILFEQYGGFNKGRGLYAEVLTRGAPSVVSPLYPLPTIGSGGNMAFRTDVLRAAGGFDPCLGAGTKTHSGEETKVFCTLLRSGETVLHWPSAIMWHFHRREMDQLQRQFFGYSAGLPAFYVSIIRSEPSTVFEIARLVPHALRDLGLRGGGVKFDEIPDDFPRELLRAGHRGLATGAFSYVAQAISDAVERRRERN